MKQANKPNPYFFAIGENYHQNPTKVMSWTSSTYNYFITTPDFYKLNF
jgi:hypothetical protein